MSLLLSPQIRAHVLQVLNRLGAPPDIQEDLAQIILTKAFQALDRYDPNRALLTTWVHQITKRVWIDQCRASQIERKHCVPLTDVPEVSYTPDQIEQEFCAEAIRTIQSSLSVVVKKRERHYIDLGVQVLHLRTMGYSDQEIAVQLQIALGTAKSAFRQLRIRITRILRENGFEELLPAEHRLAGSP